MMLTIPISKSLIFADAVKILSSLKEGGHDRQEVMLDAIHDDVELAANLFDTIGLSESVISNAFQEDDASSQHQVDVIADSITELSYDNIIELAYDFAMDYVCDEEVDDEVELDNAMPPRKMGYKRVRAVRGGKKVWINKRDPNKVIRLTPAQKAGLRKARRKSQTALQN